MNNVNKKLNYIKLKPVDRKTGLVQTKKLIRMTSNLNLRIMWRDIPT